MLQATAQAPKTPFLSIPGLFFPQDNKNPPFQGVFGQEESVKEAGISLVLQLYSVPYARSPIF